MEGCSGSPVMPSHTQHFLFLRCSAALNWYLDRQRLCVSRVLFEILPVGICFLVLSTTT